MNRKKMIMIVLAALFVLSIIYRVTHPFKQERVAQLTYTGKSVARVIEKQITPGIKDTLDKGFLQLNLFSEPPQHSYKVYANIFNPEETVRKASGVEKPPEQVQPIQDTVPAMVETPRERIKRQLGDLSFLGSYKSANNEVIFIGRGKQILPVRKGDRIDGKYKIEALTEKSITIRADSIKEPILIELSEL